MERGQLIAYHRKRLKLTQAELGEKVNVTAQAVSKWEKGLSEPDLATIQKLGKIFEIDVTEFFAEEPAEVAVGSGSHEGAFEEAAPAISSHEEAAPASYPMSGTVPSEPKIIVGYCDRCKRPIDQREKYTVEHRGRGTGTQYLYCPQCKHEMDLSHASYEYSHCKKMFKWSMLWGGIAGGAVTLLAVILAIVFKESLALLLLAVAAMAFAFTAQCFWGGFPPLLPHAATHLPPRPERDHLVHHGETLPHVPLGTSLRSAVYPRALPHFPHQHLCVPLHAHRKVASNEKAQGNFGKGQSRESLISK